MRAMSSGLVTSAFTATCFSSAASFSTPAPSWSARITLAPSLARRRAVAAPMPRAAPEISTVRPLSDAIMAPPGSSSHCVSDWIHYNVSRHHAAARARRRTAFAMTTHTFHLTGSGERSQRAPDRPRTCRLSAAYPGRVARMCCGRQTMMADPSFARPGGVQSVAISRCRSWGPRGPVSGGGPRGRRGPRGSGATRPIRAGRGEPRFRGNVRAVGVRRKPGRDAARRGRAGGGDRGPDADDSARAAAGAAASGPGLPLPGLQRPSRRGASRAPLGAGRPDDLVEPGGTVSPPSSGGARGGLPDRAIARRDAPVPEAGRPPVAGRAGVGGVVLDGAAHLGEDTQELAGLAVGLLLHEGAAHAADGADDRAVDVHERGQRGDYLLAALRGGLELVGERHDGAAFDVGQARLVGALGVHEA